MQQQCKQHQVGSEEAIGHDDELLAWQFAHGQREQRAGYQHRQQRTSE